MSDFIKHECGIALLKLKKPLEYFQEKYGTALFGINKMYLMMEKQHYRGQDGAGFASIKFDMEPGERFMSRIRSSKQQPIYDIFQKINNTISNEINKNPGLLIQSISSHLRQQNKVLEYFHMHESPHLLNR